MSSLPTVKPGTVILIGENPFIWFIDAETHRKTTEASIWTVTYSEKGPGHALFIRSELTNNQWRIYSDNLAMARWLQSTVQGMLSPESGVDSIPVFQAEFSQSGDVSRSWSQRVRGEDDEIVMTWTQMAQPMLVEDDNFIELDNPYGVSAVMLPASAAHLTLNGKPAKGELSPMELNGHPFSTGALAFAESWRKK